MTNSRFPKLSKKQVYYYIAMFPMQSAIVTNKVRSILNPMAENSFDFSVFMNKLFWSKDIHVRAGYFHIKTLLEKNNIL
jgi:hypothetical protein